MICKKCGKEIDEGLSYCPFCGEEIKKEEEPANFYQEGQPAKKPAKCWGVFAKVSKILGIVTIACCLIPLANIVSLETGVAGIVFAILGKKAGTEEANSQKRVGLVLSIVGFSVAFVTYIIYSVLLGVGSSMAWFTTVDEGIYQLNDYAKLIFRG